MAIDVTSPFRLDGKVCVVTGASSGLGERFAGVLHAAGAHVIATARRAERLDRLAGELDGLVAFPCDVTDAAQLAELDAHVADRYGAVDVLVNNAGMARPLPALEETVDEFRELVEVNLVSVFAASRLFGARMVAQGAGAIINISSMFGVVAAAPINEASYCASKAGVIHLTRELAVQWARKGVRVNAIAPGSFRSEMTAAMFDDDNQRRWLESGTPMARVGHAHELDGTLLYLAGDASSFMTGQTLVVDGGWTLR